MSYPIDMGGRGYDTSVESLSVGMSLIHPFLAWGLIQPTSLQMRPCWARTPVWAVVWGVAAITPLPPTQHARIGRDLRHWRNTVPCDVLQLRRGRRADTTDQRLKWLRGWRVRQWCIVATVKPIVGCVGVAPCQQHCKLTPLNYSSPSAGTQLLLL